MEIMNTLKSTLNTATETISDIAQTFVEKNRTQAKLNRLRMVMKSESELMNRAYIALGKEYYEMNRKGEVKLTENQQKLFKVINNSKAKIAKARDCYREIIESKNEFAFKSVVSAVPDEKPADDMIDITVACSNENEYKSNPFVEKAEAAIERSEEFAEKAEKKAEEAIEIVKDAANDFVEDVLDETEHLSEDAEKFEEFDVNEGSGIIDYPDDEESPEDELF